MPTSADAQNVSPAVSHLKPNAPATARKIEDTRALQLASLGAAYALVGNQVAAVPLRYLPASVARLPL